MKHDVLNLLVAVGIGVFIIALNYNFSGQQHSAHAAVNASREFNSSYSEREREALRRDLALSDKNILDMTGRDVYELLDQPELVRRDLPTVIWQYRTEACVLDLYFTTDSENVEAEPIVHYEVRARQSGHVAEKVKGGCIASLLKPRAYFAVLDSQAFFKSTL
ncbi:MAG: hypothetical protein CMH26_06040 [Micavibrio sp.]|nr:hypothetical protein [Micavibrio sp.]|tara:strand:- start:313 stop:801 length:489 start_codon:yes stop_codon:yes gene_type:complete